MEKRLRVCLVLAVIFCFSFSSFAKELKVGYVDMIQVFNEYNKTKDYEADLEVKKEKVKKELDEKRKGLEELNNELSVIKEEKKEAHRQKMQEKVKEYSEAARDAQVDMKKIVIDQMTEIKEDIDKIIANYAKKHKFDVMLDGNSVLYGIKSMDVTSEILKIANKQYKGKKRR